MQIKDRMRGSRARERRVLVAPQSANIKGNNKTSSTKGGQTDGVHCIRVAIGRVECLVVPSESVTKQMQFTLHATLFSLSQRTALGNIWASLPTTPQQPNAGSKGKGKSEGTTWNLNINEVLYFYTRVTDLSDLSVILEVAKVNTLSGDSISCGWGVLFLDPLSPATETVDSEGSNYCQLYYGSPRCLFSLGGNFPKGLTEMQDSRVYVVASSCASISGKVRQLFEEHTLVGKRTPLPGVEKESGVSDFLGKPKLSQRLSLFLQQIKVTFNSSQTKCGNKSGVAGVSLEACDVAASDLISELREFQEPGFFQDLVDSFMDTSSETSSTSARDKLGNLGKVKEWRLRIFGHNGYTTINKPVTITLQTRGSKASSSKVVKGKNKKKQQDEENESDDDQSDDDAVPGDCLEYSKEVEVKELLDHKDCFLVFQLIAVIELSPELVEKKKQKLKEQQAAISGTTGGKKPTPGNDVDTGDGSTDETCEKTIHVKQWNMNNCQDQGELHLDGKEDSWPLNEADELNFKFQSKLTQNMQLTLNYSKDRSSLQTSQARKKQKQGSRGLDGLGDEQGLDQVDNLGTYEQLNEIGRTGDQSNSGLLIAEEDIPMITTFGTAATYANKFDQDPLNQQTLPSFREDELTRSTPRYQPMDGTVPGTFSGNYYDQFSRSMQPTMSGTVPEDMRQIQLASPNPPPLMALSGAIEQRRPLQLSRKSYAEIVSAGFPQPKDDFGGLPTSVNADSPPLRLDMKREKGDPLSVNEIVIQLMAFSKSTLDVNSNQIESVFFSFQLYKFPPTVTKRFSLVDKRQNSNSSTNEDTFRPFILYPASTGGGGGVSDGDPPGCMCSFTLDPSVYPQAERDNILRYLASEKLLIEAWDGDSLMHLGSCHVEMGHVLRGGRPAVQTTLEYPLSPPLHATHNSNANSFLNPSNSIMSSTAQKSTSGHLHLRLINIGHSSSTSPAVGAPMLSTGNLSSSGTASTLLKQLGGSGTSTVARNNDNTLAKGIGQQKQQASRLPEVDRTLNSLLASEKQQQQQGNITLTETNTNTSNLAESGEGIERERKLVRMRQMRKSLLANGSLGGGDPKMSATAPHLAPHQIDKNKISKLETMRVEREDRDQKMRQLKLIEEYRTATKHNTIHSMLLSDITTEHTLLATFGVAELVELQLRNPMNQDAFFLVEIDQGDGYSSEDPNYTGGLQVITDERELKTLKALKNSNNPTSTDIFIQEEQTTNNKQNNNSIKIFLKPHELVYVPFKYTSVHSGLARSGNSGVSGPISPAWDQPGGNKLSKSTIYGMTTTKHDFESTAPSPSSSCEVCVRECDSSRPISVLRVNIVHQPTLVDQTLRFSHPERTVLKRSIRMPPVSMVNSGKMTGSREGAGGGGGGGGRVQVVCSDPNTLCTPPSLSVQRGEPRDLQIKTQVGGSGQVKRIYMAIYEDQGSVDSPTMMLVPSETWLLVVESVKKVDVQCTAGQVSRLSLVVRGGAGGMSGTQFHQDTTSGSTASRLVRVYVSHPGEMQVEPSEPFILSPISVVEVELAIRPLSPGQKNYTVNVVDVDYKQKMHSWLIQANSQPPQLTKAFEVNLPVTGGRGGVARGPGAVKKIPLVNQYSVRRRFNIHTDRPDLVMIGEGVKVLEAGEKSLIGLTFLPVGQKGTCEILLYVNDEHNNNEDTYCIRVNYT